MLIRKNKELEEWGHLGQTDSQADPLKKMAQLSNKHKTVDNKALERAIKGSLVMKFVTIEKDKYKFPLGKGNLVVKKTSPKQYAFEREIKHDINMEELIQDKNDFFRQNYIENCKKEVRFLSKSLDNTACNLTKNSIKPPKELPSKEESKSSETDDKLPIIAVSPIKLKDGGNVSKKGDVSTKHQHKKGKIFVDFNAYKPMELPKVFFNYVSLRDKYML